MGQKLKVVRFNGPPIPAQIHSSGAGLNAHKLQEISDARPKWNNNWIPVIEYIANNPEPDGTLPSQEEIAVALEVSRITIYRLMNTLLKFRAYYRVNFNGKYAYTPDFLIVKDEDGEVIYHHPL